MKNRLPRLVKVMDAVRPRSTLVRLVGLLPLLAVTMAAGPCGKEPLGSVDGGGFCTYEGKVYRPDGSSIPSADGCNSCTCGTDGLLVCTHRTCLDGGSDASDATGSDGATTCIDPQSGQVISCADAGSGVICTYAGQRYAVGATFLHTDGCSTCTCAASGEVICKDDCRDAGVRTGVCTPGRDWTCNEDPTVSSIRGTCQPDGSCTCSGTRTSPYTGKCLAADDPTGDGCELGKTFPVGATFMCSDACSTCTCAAPGKIVTTDTSRCADGGGASCGLDAVYLYGDVGGLQAYQDQVSLAPSPASPRTSATYTRTRNYVDGSPGVSCAPAFPACGDAAAIDVSDIMADILDPVVQKYLLTEPTKAPFLGFDTRPIDGTAFSFLRGDGHGFLVGQACGTSSAASSCVPIPAPIDKLVKDLRALDDQQLRSTGCAALR